MYSEKALRTKEIKHVLENLCEDTAIEAKTLLGSNYKEYIFHTLRCVTEKQIIKLKSSGEAVGLFGLIPFGDGVGGIFLLTTDNLHKGNVITFLRRAKLQIQKWESKYSLIMDRHYKKNETIKKWLKLLGFVPSEAHQDKDFQIYYKGNIGLYKND